MDTPTDRSHEDGRATVPAWLISFAAHAVIGLAFSLVIFTSTEPTDQRQGPILVHADIPRPEKLEAIKDEPVRPTIERPVMTTIETLVDRPPTTVAETPELPQITIADEPVGNTDRPDPVSSPNFNGSQGVMTIGVGPGDGRGRGKGTGIYSNRDPGRGPWGGPHRPQPPRFQHDAIEAALDWLKRHQSANGMWDSSDHWRNCSAEGKCEPGADHEQSDADIAATALALRCFLSVGYDHLTPTKHRETVRRGLAWLLAQQRHDGLWGRRNYEHAIATMAVAETYGMTDDAALLVPAQKGTDYLLAKQNRDARNGGRLGWDYVEPTGRNDSSVTGWCVMALKSAAASGLAVKDGLHGARTWLEMTWRMANPDHARLDPYNGISEFGYSWKDGRWEGEHRGDRVPLGALCAVFLGYGGDHPVPRTLVNYAVKNQMPSEYPCNTYYLYYNTLAVFQLGGDAWKRWSDTACTMLVQAQRRDGCFHGSWDFAGTQFHGHQLGRLFSTTLCCLSLEVYSIYSRVGTGSAAMH